jgi:ABC-type branched-subunit amino acid transport system ATPase component
MDGRLSRLAPRVVDQVFGLIADMDRTGASNLFVERKARRAPEMSDRACVMARSHRRNRPLTGPDGRSSRPCHLLRLDRRSS